MSAVASVCRTIWGEPIGPALTAYDVDGAILIVIPCKPRSVSKWVRGGTAKADKRRCQKALEGKEGEPITPEPGCDICGGEAH